MKTYTFKYKDDVQIIKASSLVNAIQELIGIVGKDYIHYSSIK